MPQLESKPHNNNNWFMHKLLLFFTITFHVVDLSENT